MALAGQSEISRTQFFKDSVLVGFSYLLRSLFRSGKSSLTCGTLCILQIRRFARSLSTVLHCLGAPKGRNLGAGA